MYKSETTQNIIQKSKEVGSGIITTGKNLINNPKTAEIYNESKNKLSQLNEKIKDSGVYDKITTNSKKGLEYLNHTGQ